MAELFLIASLLILVSLAIARFFEDFGVPSLLLFIGIGMLAGREGLGYVSLTDPSLTQGLGVLSLVVILFSGGLSTHWPSVRPHVRQAAALSTLGVLVTAAVVGAFAHWVLGFSWVNGLLLGSIISSTDAAAVFSTLRSRNLSLKGGLKHLLELESGSNDPMAVFLTVSFIQLALEPSRPVWIMLPLFFWQLTLGLALGWGLGRAAVWLANQARFAYDGFYMVFFLAFAVFTYGLTDFMKGSGFLAVYVAALVIGNHSFVQKKSVVRFYDGLSWLAQISLFLALGLLVAPSQLLGSVLSEGLMISAVLMFLARPLAAFLSLANTAWNWREKLFVGWVGLRGAVPIVLATYLLLGGAQDAQRLFHLTFFIVLSSALLQGWTVPAAARLLGAGELKAKDAPRPLEFTAPPTADSELEEFIVPFGSAAAGRTLAQLSLPKDANVVLMGRGGQFLEPNGASVLEEGDTLMVLASKETKGQVQATLARMKAAHDAPPPNGWFG